MKVLVLGGTGAMGIHLVDLLVKSNHQVYVSTRSKKASQYNLTYVQGNAKDTLFLSALLETHWDVIIDFMVYGYKEFNERAELLLKSTKQYIFMSSARVYADSDTPLLEHSPRLIDTLDDDEYFSIDEYGISKARQENLLLNSNYDNWTIIRPYITYSECRLQLGVLEKEAWLYRAIQGRTVLFSEDINDKVTTLTYGFDVAYAINSLIGNRNACREIFHITSDQSLRWSEVIDIYCTTLKKIKGIDLDIRLQSMEDFSLWCDSKYQIKYDRLYDRVFCNHKISSFVDTSKFLNPHDGLERSMKEFLNENKYLRIDWKKEAIKDRILNSRTPIFEIEGLKQKVKYNLYRYFS